jgi:isoquinoline 1-oxidoreductase beta subunit
MPRESSALSRRSFVLSAASVGGALAIGLRVADLRPSLVSPPESAEIQNWITVAPDSTVTIRIAQVEMGQGTMTAMVQLLAEELEVDWSTIKTKFISIAAHLACDRCYGRTETSASDALRRSDVHLRTIGAQIRTMLVRAAAQRLSVPEYELVAEASTVRHLTTGQALRYGELAADAAKIAVPDPDSVRLKEAKDWKYIGRPMKRLDIPSKVDGTAIFGIDVSIPGMKYAAIKICPVFGGRLKSYDSKVVLSQPAVRQVVKVSGGKAGYVEGMDDAIAVIADSWWQARRAIDMIPIEWEPSNWAATDSSMILANLRTGLTGAPDKILRRDGTPETALSDAAQVLKATYFTPYLEHAAMEPINCTALVTDDRFEVWAPTQHPEDAIHVAAKVAGLPVSKGELHLVQLGGGFGRRIACDFVSQAVQIAGARKGVPVKLVWTREDTTRHSFYRQASLCQFQGGINLDGKVTAWDHRFVCQYRKEEADGPFGADTILYSIPNVNIEFSVRNSPVPAGPMRGIGYSINCFGIQSFIDELAAFLGRDSYEFQRALLDPVKTPPTVPTGYADPGLTPSMRAARLGAVLDEAAQRSNWDSALGPNRGRGIAVHEEEGGFYAVVVEVTLDGKGWFAIDRVVVAGDPGRLANPDNARAQIEGSVGFGLTSAIFGEITIRNGGVLQGNFNDYEMLRISEMPEVEVYWLLDRPTWGNVSQAVVSVIQPALTNAIFNAGGPRIRFLPIKNHKIFLRDR